MLRTRDQTVDKSLSLRRRLYYATTTTTTAAATSCIKQSSLWGLEGWVVWWERASFFLSIDPRGDYETPPPQPPFQQQQQQQQGRRPHAQKKGVKSSFVFVNRSHERNGSRPMKKKREKNDKKRAAAAAAAGLRRIHRRRASVRVTSVVLTFDALSRGRPSDSSDMAVAIKKSIKPDRIDPRNRFGTFFFFWSQGGVAWPLIPCRSIESISESISQSTESFRHHF